MTNSKSLNATERKSQRDCKDKGLSTGVALPATEAPGDADKAAGDSKQDVR